MSLLHSYIASACCCIVLFAGCADSKQDKETNEATQQANSNQTCIDQVMALDDSLGKVRNRVCKTAPLSTAIQQYITAVGQFDFSDCPKDFEKAYKNHIKAWSDMLAVTDHYADLRGEMHDLFDELKVGSHADEFNAKLKVIWDTWKQVEQFIQPQKALDVADCMVCDRISLFAKCKDFVSDQIWKELNKIPNTPPLLYYTDSTTYIAFLTDETLLTAGYQEVHCEDGLLLKKLNKRLDAQPFHMENKMSFSDTTSMFYYRPMMLCSDVETTVNLVPEFTATEDWLQLVMHEYFHSFQFSHKAYINHLADNIKMGADTLDKIYQQNLHGFQEVLLQENNRLRKAIATNDNDSLAIYAGHFIEIREKRRMKYEKQFGFELTKMENFWETIEGTARYTEYYMAGGFNNIPIPELNTCDSLFQNFDDYKDADDFNKKEKFVERTKIMVAYYYATGFNLCRLMDKLGYEYKTELFHHPEKSLYTIFLENHKSAQK